MDVNSLIKAFGALDSGSLDTTHVEVTASTRDTQVNSSLIARLPTSSSDTAAATQSPTKTSLPPQASLLGLPQELRDQIYGYLTEDESRIVLGWRFVELWKRHYPKLSHEDCFTSAIALHPLSMTCRQMLSGFQPALLRATETRWIFVVNNFDQKQLLFFDDQYKSMYPNDLIDGEPDTPQLTLRFQMDNNAVSSADKLRDLCLSTDLDDYDTMRHFQSIAYGSSHTEVAAFYQPRTGASAKHVRGMTRGEAKRIEFTLRDLYHVFRPLRDLAFYTDHRLFHMSFGH
jgi:hypothetical protein